MSVYVFFFFFYFYFFFQAEDGIRDWSVTGVQTCALPICQLEISVYVQPQVDPAPVQAAVEALPEVASVTLEIGRASCRERV